MSISVIAALLVLYGLVTLVPKLVLAMSPEVYERTADLTGAMTSGGLVRLSLHLQIAYSFLTA